MLSDNILIFIIPLLLAVVAFLYSTVGHGGASGHIAVLSIVGISTIYIKSSALVLNVLVSGIAFYQYYKSGYFKWKLLAPFLITSIPFAFLGGMINIEDPVIYQRILAVCLLFPIIRLLGFGSKESKVKHDVNILLAIFIGAIIGFLSGLMGIGGGILLSPIIILLAWANLKEAAAVSSLFILLNSISGLIALYIKGITISPQIWIWIIGAFTGGFLGAYYGSRKFNTVTLRYFLAVVLCIASIKLAIG